MAQALVGWEDRESRGPCTGLGHEEADPEAARPGLPVGVLDTLKRQFTLECIRPEMLHMEGSWF